jgi:hypothetical protein
MKTNASIPSAHGRLVRLSLLASLTLALALPLAARQGTPPPSQQLQVQPVGIVHQVVLPATDVVKELGKDSGKGMPVPLRFAVPQLVKITPATHGTWETVPGGQLWRLRLQSTGATDLNLGFGLFWLPEGATLHIASETEQYYQGPYTAQDNKEHGQLWTPLVPGEAAVVELFVPAEAAHEPRLVLSQIGTGYRDLFHRKDDGNVPKIGACNIDAVCPQADPWRNELRSVAAYTVNGTWTCTGSLVGNTANNFRNFFLTANHCDLSSDNAASVVVYWNFQSPSCGMLSGGSLAQNQSGAIFRAARADVDMALIELEDVPNPAFNVHYAGWDRSGVAPAGCVGIHQPGCDEKCISFSTLPLTTVNSCIGSGGVNSHWYVRWSLGVTEPGSSGSGIWDSTSHRLVGFLSGGASACGGSDLTDCYGKVSVAWTGASAATRLSDWLDPLNTGVSGIPGTDPFPQPVLTTAGYELVAEACAPTNGVVDPGEMVTVNLMLRNLGTLATTSLIGTLQATGGIVLPGGPQNYGALAPGGAVVSRPFTFQTSGNCGGTLTASLALQDGAESRGTVSFSIPMGVATTNLMFSQNFDGVTVPALPAGWTASPASVWTTSTAARDTVPNSAFTADPSTVSDRLLTSPPFAIQGAGAPVSFRHFYNTESSFDGGVLEISISGGAFTDLVTAGGSFVSGGYNGTISTSYSSPIGGRAAWNGNSGGFITTTALLPPAAAGNSVQLRWRLATDSSVSGVGWYVDSIALSSVSYNCCVPLVRPTLVNTHGEANRIVFGHTTVSGQSYVVEGKTDMSGALWAPLRTNAGDGTVKFYTNDTTSAASRYFRVRTQ